MFLASTLAASAAGLLHSPSLALAGAPAVGRQVPGAYRFKVGSFEVTAINDGLLQAELGWFPTADKTEAARILESAFLGPDKFPTAVNAFLVNTGDRLVLVDAGTATAMGPTLGRVAANLREAGVDPASIDAVLLTHMHPDHANGLVLNGAPAFPKAEVLVAEAEHAFWTDDGALARAAADAKPFFAMARGAVQPYSGRLRRFAPGGEVVPGITSVAAYGHTPGHTMFRVSSAGQTLLIWGDVVHSAVLQTAHPEWALGFDTDQAAAIETRRRVFDQVAAERLMVAGMHLPFPGIGHLAREGGAYRYVPAFWSSEL